MADTTTQAPESEAPKSPVIEVNNFDPNALVALLNQAQAVTKASAILKAKSAEDRSKLLSELSACEAFQLLTMLSIPGVRSQLESKLGSDTINEVLRSSCQTVEGIVFELNTASRAESLERGKEGFGVYAAQTPGGTLGLEVGAFNRENKDGKTVTTRGGVGAYIRAHQVSAPAEDKESAGVCKDFAAMLLA